MCRSNHRRCCVRKGVLRSFAKFTRKNLCQSLFLNKVAGLIPATLLKKRLWCRYFSINSAKFLRIPFLQNTSARLLQFLKYLTFRKAFKWKCGVILFAWRKTYYLQYCHFEMHLSLAELLRTFAGCLSISFYFSSPTPVAHALLSFGFFSMVILTVCLLLIMYI